MTSGAMYSKYHVSDHVVAHKTASPLLLYTFCSDKAIGT